eukprot:gene10545-biopygen252
MFGRVQHVGTAPPGNTEDWGNHMEHSPNPPQGPPNTAWTTLGRLNRKGIRDWWEYADDMVNLQRNALQVDGVDLI